jgi:hypothetical protein
MLLFLMLIDFLLVLVELRSAALVGFSKVPTSLLLILLNFSTNYPNFFMPLLLIPLQTSRKAASPEGAFVLRRLVFFFTGDFNEDGGLFWLCSAGGGGGGGRLGDGDGDTTHVMEHIIIIIIIQSTLMIIMGWKNWTQVGRPMSTKMILMREANN